MNEIEKAKIITQYYGDGTSSENKLTKLIDQMLITYGGIGNDHTDFYSVANETFTRCLNTFDETREAKFDTFLSNCLQNKIKSHITYINRDKRKNKDVEGNLIPNDSLDRTINESDTETTVGSMIVDRKQSTEIQAMDMMGNVEEYIATLKSPIQKKIVECWLNDLSHVETREELGLSESDYNRIFAEMKTYDKIRLLKRTNNTTSEINKSTKEGIEDMAKRKFAEDFSKSKHEVIGVDYLIRFMDEDKIITTYPLQREANQWDSVAKGDLIVSMLHNFRINPLVICEEEVGNGDTWDWLVDGKQRSTTIYEFKHDLFKISKNCHHTEVSYYDTMKDGNGNTIKDEMGRPQRETHSVDVAGMKYSDLPFELRHLFDLYQVPTEKYLDCDEEEIQFHIIRYNNAKAMSVAAKGTLRLGEFAARTLNTFMDESTFFNETRELTGLKRVKRDALKRIIIESIMTTMYPDDWNKSYDKNCEFLSDMDNEEVLDFFNEFKELTEDMNSVIDAETGKLLTQKNTLIWLAVYNNFLAMKERNSALTTKTFRDFMIKFEKFVDIAVDGTTFATLDEKGSKDTKIIRGKIDVVTTLLEKYLSLEKEEVSESVEEITETESEEVLPNEEGVVEASFEPVEEKEEEAIKEEVEEPVIKADEVTTVSDDDVEEIPFEEEKPVEEPVEQVEETVKQGEQVEEEIDDLFKYIDAFAEIDLVKNMNATERDINRAAIVTAMIADKEKSLEDDDIRDYIDTRDFSQYEVLITKVKEGLDKVNNWATFVTTGNNFVTIQNIPVLACLGREAISKAYDDAKCKRWFETYALTYSAKGLDDKGYLEILNATSKDMERSCKEVKKPALVF